MVRLSDYRQYPYLIPNINLEFHIYEEFVRVASSMSIASIFDDNPPLILEGIDLEIESIKINAIRLKDSSYKLDDNRLIIYDMPNDPFNLEIINIINPYGNTSLEGLYNSGEILVTQCEAEGFRRICFHPDRPDVLSKYRVLIEADVDKFPVLLSNGNLVQSRLLSEDVNRRKVVWEDPFPKPSYLFALVAGKLKQVKDSYLSSLGKNIKINFFVEEGDEGYTSHAITSLKKAMAWDEKSYNLEYDLDEYNVVAVRHFNMGAMENKGLNIFNSKLVLSDTDISTDDELERIEGVVAHEYFHNWTGNRITCRDWFQLSLKEGLTVFRDQSFTADLHSFGIKRIQDVSLLRRVQFREDSGPTSHAVKPNEYISIDNFYTTTIYEKGAELVRMLQLLVGKKQFLDGINNYIRKYDGSAATTEDFVYAVIDGAFESREDIGFDIDQFIHWYYNAGTPKVVINQKWNQQKGTLSIVCEQIVLDENKDVSTPLVIPILMAVIGREGIIGKEKLFVLDKLQDEFIFQDIVSQDCPPTLSVFRGFSAPVNWDVDNNLEQLIHLIKYDNDSFVRWDSSQRLLSKVILSRTYTNPDILTEQSLIESFSYLIKTLGDNQPAFLSSLMSSPDVSELEVLHDEADPIELKSSILFMKRLIGTTLGHSLKQLINSNKRSLGEKWPEGKGFRTLIAFVWTVCSLADDLEIRKDSFNAVKSSSMTLARAGLYALHNVDCAERELALNAFYDRWKNKPIILDTWFSLEASTPRNDSLKRIEELLFHPLFDFKAPNAIRAVLGGFVSNTDCFHNPDGSGYKFLANQILDVDKRNPITASRIIKAFSRWKHYKQPQKNEMYKVINYLERSKLSSNTSEVLDLILEKD